MCLKSVSTLWVDFVGVGGGGTRSPSFTDIIALTCDSLWGKAMFSVELSWDDAAVHISSLLLCPPTPEVVASFPPLSLAGCLFVCGDVLVSVQSFRFFFLYQQHASTNATMVFKANCDVHYFNCCSILFKDLISSCIDWQAHFFLCCDLGALSSLSAVFCPPWTYNTNSF